MKNDGTLTQIPFEDTEFVFPNGRTISTTDVFARNIIQRCQHIPFRIIMSYMIQQQKLTLYIDFTITLSINNETY
jgi:hypothetical protein